jgi:hypothetical protein
MLNSSALLSWRPLNSPRHPGNAGFNSSCHAGAARIGPYGTRLTGLHDGAFWEPDDPTLISFSGPAWFNT